MCDGIRAVMFAIVTILVVCSASAQDEVSRVTFDEAVHMAMEQSRDVQRASTAILRAEALLQEARSVSRPTVSGALAETRLSETPEFNGQPVQPLTQFSATATAAVTVLDAAGWARRAQAADRVEIARLAAEDVRREIAIAAAQAYLAVIAQHRQVEVEDRARQTARAQYDYAWTRYEGGLGSRLNALRAKEALATDEVRLTRARLALRLSQEALGLILAADAPMDTAGEPTFEIPSSSGEEWLPDRTDIRLFEARRDAAERVAEDSWKDWVPTLELSFTPRYVDASGPFEPDSSWRAVLGANIPIFDGGIRRANRHLRKAEFSSAEIDLDQARLRARAEERSARAAVAATERGVESARLAAESANEVLEITAISFQAGATTNIELIDAQRRARDSETAVAAAEDLLRQARLELLVALGAFP
jgi:outer membrane protein TolC